MFVSNVNMTSNISGDQAQGSNISWPQDPTLCSLRERAGGDCEEGFEMHREAEHSIRLSLQVYPMVFSANQPP